MELSSDTYAAIKNNIYPTVQVVRIKSVYERVQQATIITVKRSTLSVMLLYQNKRPPLFRYIIAVKLESVVIYNTRSKLIVSYKIAIARRRSYYGRVLNFVSKLEKTLRETFESITIDFWACFAKPSCNFSPVRTF